MDKIIRCQICGARNYAPVEVPSAGQRYSCNSCGTIILKKCGINECVICYGTKSGSDVILTNSTIIHKSCLDNALARLDQADCNKKTKTSELQTLAYRISASASPVDRLRKYFTGKRRISDAHRAAAIAIKNEINLFEAEARYLKSQLREIYDYFPSYPPDWEERRKFTLSYYNYKCSKCGKSAVLHVHHVTPLSNGGSNKDTNLVALCEKCHLGVHGMKSFKGGSQSSAERRQTTFQRKVDKINKAIEDGLRLRFKYKKFGEKKSKQRTIRPKLLTNVSRQNGCDTSLCVRGFCEKRQEDRVFAISRMTYVEVL